MEPPSSPPNADATPEESLTWYKNQYEQLAVELTEFRESSHELEAELEKDLEAADKRERTLRERAEGLQFEADEWKVSILLLYELHPQLALTGYTGEMQEGQGRGEFGAKQPREGNHHITRRQQNTSTQAAGH